MDAITPEMMREFRYKKLRERYGEGTYDELIQKARDNWKRYKKEHALGEFDWKTWAAKRKAEREQADGEPTK
jgi:hypothetical protein